MRPLLAGLVFAACVQPSSGNSTPRVATGSAATPSALVQADVEHAEDAERVRRHNLARAAYLRAVADARDPASEDFAHREYAETLETWGELDTAADELRAAVAAEPNDAAGWNDLGVLYHLHGDDSQALAALETSKRLAPRDWRPRRQLAALLLTLHDYDRAAAEYRAMLALDLPDRLRDAIHRALDLLARRAPTPST